VIENEKFHWQDDDSLNFT